MKKRNQMQKLQVSSPKVLERENKAFIKKMSTFPTLKTVAPLQTLKMTLALQTLVAQNLRRTSISKKCMKIGRSIPQEAWGAFNRLSRTPKHSESYGTSQV